MKLPKMIFFDYTHTLFHDPPQDYFCSTRLIMAHVIGNLHCVTARDLFDTFYKEYSEPFSIMRSLKLKTYAKSLMLASIHG